MSIHFLYTLKVLLTGLFPRGPVGIAGSIERDEAVIICLYFLGVWSELWTVTNCVRALCASITLISPRYSDDDSRSAMKVRSAHSMSEERCQLGLEHLLDALRFLATA
jgi:hypothetical protein